MSNSRHPIVVTHLDRAQFAVQIGEHRLITDQPRSGGGDDAGPTPLDFLAASLGGCIALYVTRFCEAREIAHEGLQVEVRYHTVSAPSRVGGFEVRVVLPANVPKQVVELVERVARTCPAHNTLTHGADVSIAAEIVLPSDEPSLTDS